jgi:3-hydroxyacyl-[acyl-carrier-protein] dehydratase
MRFQLIDRIDAYEAHRTLRACKFLASGEEYLADHFPRFPVMPGVLMLQTLAEAAAWLWRLDTDFEQTVIVLREAKNVKYGSFMQPGRRMDVSVQWVGTASNGLATFKGKGSDDAGQQTVAAHFTLAGYCLAGRGLAGQAADMKLRDHWRSRWALLTGQLAEQP